MIYRRLGNSVKYSLKYLTLTIAALLSFSTNAQIGVGANFGIEAECYSGDVTSGAGTDDWYLGTSGSGVVDEATALAMGYAAQLAANNNIAFDLRQSLPNYYENNGYLWYSTRYGRDYVNQGSQDLTTFTGGKNGQNPTTQWGTSSGTLPAKTDIVDAAVHMRRDGILTTDDLWVDLVISTLDNSGNHFVDFELFVSELQQSDPGFTNSGTQEGHTAWEFDAGGNVTQIGDMIVGFAFSGGGVSGVDIRLWVRRSVFNPGTSPGGTSTFTWGSNISGGSTYGYGQIVVPVGSILSHVNTVSVAAPPWGTTNTSGYTATYSAGNLAEVGLNFRALGFDPELLFGGGAACDSPFSAVLTKSRTSSSFTSTLKDFSGPYDFLGSASGTQVNTAIIDPGDFDSCNTGETFTLEAEFDSSVAEYYWYSLTPGVVFPANGLDEISGANMTTVTIDTPGDYQLGIAPLPGCTPVTDPANILAVDASPCAIDDYFVVLENSLLTDPNNTLGVVANDVDLENDIDTSTLNNSGLLQPSNGTISIIAGVLRYQPDPNYVGIDTFEYEICDSSSPSLCDIAMVIVYVSSDTDNDGIADTSDLDDDNDGIPDSEELGTIINNDQPACGGETTLDFSSPAVLESGTDLQQGAVYRIANITAGTDALITIAQVFNATVVNVDRNVTSPESFKPQTGFSFANAGDRGYIEYKIQFVTSGGSSPVVIPKLFINFNDIDGNTNYSEENWADNPATYTIDNPTELTMTTDGSWVLGSGSTIDHPASTSIDPEVNFAVNYNSKSEIVLRVGALAHVDGASSSARSHSIEFACVTNYVSPETYGIDSDSDGISNQIDLDSDNDGIYDAEEAGHGQAYVAGVVTSTYGPNGLADVVETVAESGVINYTIRNTDGTDPPDYLDTDSDDDGCVDANEAYSSATADSDDNGHYSSGLPPSVTADGLVSAASYGTPGDLDSNSTHDYRENTAPAISAQPTDTTACPGCNATYTAAGTNLDTFQWQVYNGSIWVDLSDAGIYSGTQTATLLLTNVTTAENNNQYRLLVDDSAYICGPVASNTANLLVRVNSIITNRRITYRVNKN